MDINAHEILLPDWVPDSIFFSSFVGVLLVFVLFVIVFSVCVCVRVLYHVSICYQPNLQMCTFFKELA